MNKLHHVVSVSGGKDSAATLMLALAMEVPNLRAAFADTGHEHPLTYDYVDYLEQATGVPIQRIRRDFTEDFTTKRKYIAEKWPSLGVPAERIARALELMHPTGIPFLDACLVAGRFPSPLGKFCTRQLKVEPLIEQVMMPLLDDGDAVWSWQGVRADESFARSTLPEFEVVGGGLFNYRPIIRWAWQDVFEAHRYMGINPNPLYAQGCSRVGCMPCIHATKDEILNLAQRWPEYAQRVAEWESLVDEVSRGSSPATFFNNGTEGGLSIVEAVEWSKTARGGKQFDMFRTVDAAPSCSSSYGLCG
ncbi:3'-phosphoadenosine 5'-phosphosulfate sulfotransferase (PAPS reductase)/FAD synthetase [Bradyrhizobium sp. USDA 327]